MLIAEEFYLKLLNKLQLWVTKSHHHMLKLDLCLVLPISNSATTDLGIHFSNALSWWVYQSSQDQQRLKKPQLTVITNLSPLLYYLSALPRGLGDTRSFPRTTATLNLTTLAPVSGLSAEHTWDPLVLASGIESLLLSSSFHLSSFHTVKYQPTLLIRAGRAAVVTTHHVAAKSPTPSTGFISTYARTPTRILSWNGSFGYNTEANITDTVWHGTNWVFKGLSVWPGDRQVWSLKINCACSALRELLLVMKILSNPSIYWRLFICNVYKTRQYLKAAIGWWAKLKDEFPPLLWLHNTFIVIFSDCRQDLIFHEGNYNEAQRRNVHRTSGIFS